MKEGDERLLIDNEAGRETVTLLWGQFWGKGVLGKCRFGYAFMVLTYLCSIHYVPFALGLVTNVSCVQPSVYDGFLGCLWVAQIRCHEARASNEDFTSDIITGKLFSVVIDDPANSVNESLKLIATLLLTWPPYWEAAFLQSQHPSLDTEGQ